MVNCSTAANYYHVLRRQVLRNFRKPLICMTGKFTLRLKEATSEMAEMSEGTRFRRVIEEGHGAAAEEDLVAPDQMRRLVLCSGKVYYDLQRARKLNNITDVALVRVEQLCPFPFGASHSRPRSSRASVSENHCAIRRPREGGDRHVPASGAGVVPGGAEEPGGLAVRPPPDRDGVQGSGGPGHAAQADVHRPPERRVHRHRLQVRAPSAPSVIERR